MDDPPLRDMPEIETVEVDDDDNNPGIRDSQTDGTRNLDHEDMSTPNPTMSVHLPPEDLTDRTFLMPPNEDGSRYRAKIVGIINDHVSKTEGHPEVFRLKCIVNDQYQEVVAYNKIVEFIEDDQTWDGVWKFRKIHDHQGPIRPSDPRYIEAGRFQSWISDYVIFRDASHWPLLTLLGLFRRAIEFRY